MKKVLIIFTIAFSTTLVFGQELKVKSALTALKENNYDEAKLLIDQAMEYPGTRDNADALFAKARIYTQMQEQKVPQYIAGNPYREAANALMKLAELKPDYKKADVDIKLYSCAINFYNDGVVAFNKNNSKEGVECMKAVIKIHDLNGGKRFEKYTEDKFPLKQFNKLAAASVVSAATSLYIDKKYEDAVQYFILVLNNPSTDSPANYNLLAESYLSLNKDKEYFEVVEKGRSKFPKDKLLMNKEINYFIKAGKFQELVKKLEDAMNVDANNTDILFDYALICLNIYNSKDKNINLDEYFTKSEDAFMKLLAKLPDEPIYNYNFGVLYFNKGSLTNDQQNVLANIINEKGSKATKDDQKKFDDMQALRNSFFAKALPYFEKAYNFYSAKSSLSNEEKDSFRNCVTNMKFAYSYLNQNDKYNEMNEKLNQIK